MVQAVSKSNVEFSSLQHSTNLIGKRIIHSGLTTRYVHIDSDLQLTLVELNSGTGALKTHRVSFNDMLMDNLADTLSYTEEVSQTITAGYKIARFDMYQQNLHAVFYYDDSGTTELTNPKSYSPPETSSNNCIYASFMSSGEKRRGTIHF